jgi:hypothetical protein
VSSHTRPKLVVRLPDGAVGDPVTRDEFDDVVCTSGLMDPLDAPIHVPSLTTSIKRSPAAGS